MSVEVDLEQPDERLVGQVLANRYQIEMRLGEGAMGAVYRAKHVKVGRPFAVKFLHPRLLEDPKQLQRFEREAELAGRLRHPNVIGVVDVGETPDGLRYMVMDFAEGPDLATLLSEAPMPPQRVIHLVRQLLEGLFHAHQAGLIHRDFKPENVIVERDTHGSELPRIVDFGIAILREGGDSPDGPGRLTTNGLVLGTPHYMAPEQAVADPIDHRIDLFALGIMIYEMLCGKLPFDGGGAEVARANLLLDPPPIAQRVPYLEVDPLLEAFARRLMAKKRDQRPATAKVARDLLDLVERDREAAAKALGVPLAAVREPMTTQPNAPARHASGDGTFPPPVRSAVETPPQAPPMKDARAVPARPDVPQLTTETTASPRRRTPIIVASLFGAAVLGGGLFLALRSDDTHATKSQPPVAVAPPAPTPTEPATPVEARPTEPKPAETPTATEPVDVAVPGETTPDKVDTAATPPPQPGNAKKATKATKTAVKTTGTAAAKTGATSSTPKHEQTVAATTQKPAQPQALDPKAFAALYQGVGSQLKALEQAKGADAASDLQSRFRMIRFADAVSTQPKRDEAAAILSKLASEIAARKK